MNELIYHTDEYCNFCIIASFHVSRIMVTVGKSITGRFILYGTFLLLASFFYFLFPSANFKPVVRFSKCPRLFELQGSTVIGRKKNADQRCREPEQLCNCGPMCRMGQPEQ